MNFPFIFFLVLEISLLEVLPLQRGIVNNIEVIVGWIFVLFFPMFLNKRLIFLAFGSRNGWVEVNDIVLNIVFVVVLLSKKGITKYLSWSFIFPIFSFSIVLEYSLSSLKSLRIGLYLNE